MPSPDAASDPPRSPPGPGQHQGRSAWRTVGIVLGVMAAVAGLFVVAAVIVFVVSLNSWASNK